MSVVSLYNVPTAPELLQQFSFENADSHNLIIRAILAKTGIQLELYQLDPIPRNDLGDWAYRHQAMHNAMNTILNVSGNDLTEVNFADKGELETWIFLHAAEHVQAHQELGI